MKLKNICKILLSILIIYVCFIINNKVNADDPAIPLDYYFYGLSGHDYVSYEVVEASGMRYDYKKNKESDGNRNRYVDAERTVVTGKECYIKIKITNFVANTNRVSIGYGDQVYMVDENEIGNGERKEYYLINDYRYEDTQDASDTGVEGIGLQEGTYKVSENEGQATTVTGPRVTITKYAHNATVDDYECMFLKIDFTNLSMEAKNTRHFPKISESADGYWIYIKGPNESIPLIRLKGIYDEDDINSMMNRDFNFRIYKVELTDYGQDKDEFVQEILSPFGIQSFTWSDAFVEGGGWYEDYLKTINGSHQLIQAKEDKTITLISEDTGTHEYEIKKDSYYNLEYHFFYKTMRDIVLYKVGIFEVNENGNDIETDETAREIYEETNNAIQEYIRITRTLMNSISEVREPLTYFYDVLEDTGLYQPESDGSGQQAESIIGTMLKTITNIGIVIAILMLVILGVKYMLGSIEEKVEYKKDLVPYLVGSVLLFGICTVMKIMLAMGDSINNI